MLCRIKPFVKVGLELGEEEQREFETIRKTFNIQRGTIICYFMLILNLILVLIDLTFYKPMRKVTSAYTYLFYSHIIIILSVILWLIIIYFMNNYWNNTRLSLMYNLLGAIVIYWGVFLGLNGLNTGGQISAYIICTLALSLVLYLNALESLVCYLSSLIIFIIGLASFTTDKNILYSHIVNAIITILCSYIASNINYSAIKKDFINRKIVLNSQRELLASNTKLMEYEKLRSDFFANISHELRTPLNIIYSSQQIIERVLKSKNDNSVNKYLKMIRQNSFRLMKLVSNIIDMTKIDATIYSIKPYNCDIVALVEDITMSAAGYIENKGMSLIFDTAFEEKVISCDPEKIERIILNLLSNAVKFSYTGGTIYVNIYMDNDKVIISVKDKGIGIPENMKELIFEKFVQLDKSIDRNREGSGIGLSLVKSLVEMHNGTITVNSILGQGSEFILSLPDKLTDSDCTEEYINCLEGQRSERINIEFSDI